MDNERPYSFVPSGCNGEYKRLTTVCEDAELTGVKDVGLPKVKVGSASCEKWCKYFISVNRVRHTVVCSAPPNRPTGKE